jgi:hydrogenase nickel incorporation protein HypB
VAEVLRVQVLENILKANDYLANKLSREWQETQTLVVNLLSSPGGGKTTLLEATLPQLKDRYRVLVLEGDIETERDAQRIRALGVKTLQITTGGTCHLEAHMVEQAWKLTQEEEPFDFIFIENVGNLVCPASYALGEHLRVVLLSVPEGDDKPLKYPKAFRSSQAFMVTKADLLPYFDFSVQRACQEALSLQPQLATEVVSAQTGEGIKEWVQFLQKQREKHILVKTR